jgi:flagellar assembly factor FliW
MSLTIDSVRFGKVELSNEQVIDFPRGLIGLAGRGYALLAPTAASAFYWLHSTEHAALALPVVDPLMLIPGFSLELSESELQAIGLTDIDSAQLYVTITAAPNPLETTLNLRAPLVIWERQGYQVINHAPGAQLRAPLPPREHMLASTG